MDAARHGAGQAVSGERAQPGDRVVGKAAQRLAAGGEREHHVAVERRMHRPDGAGEAVLGHHRHALGLRRRQDGVHRHAGDGGVAARGGGLGEPPVLRIGPQAGRAQAAELVADLEGRGPEGPPAGRDHRAPAVHRHQGAHREAVLRDDGGRADAALERAGHRAVARPGRAEVELAVRRSHRRATELAVGRCLGPGLVAAVGQVEEDGGRDHRRGRHARAQLVAAAPRAHPADHAVGRGQAVDRAAGQHHGVHRLHQVLRRQRVGLPRAGGPAAHSHRADRPLVRQDDRHSGAHAHVLRLADLEPGHVRDQVKSAGRGA